MADVYVTVDDREFLRGVRARTVYQSDNGMVMQRGGKAGTSKRAGGVYRKAVAQGWIEAEPDAERRYQLTAAGVDALAAREASC